MRSICIAVILGFSLCVVHAQGPSQETRTKFHEVHKKIVDSNWKALPVGRLMTKVAQQLIGVQYVGGTLDGPGREMCSVDMLRLDCVTLFEVTLNMARIMHLGKDSITDLVEAVTFTRYRDGMLTDYTSRLHYTSDWIDNNIKKGVIADVTKELGGEPFPLHLGFMSKNPKYYPALVANPEFVDVMRAIEERVNATQRFIIPTSKIEQIENQLQDGDIIAIATSKAGLDYSHTGLIVRDGSRARFLHASSAQKRVVFDKPIADYVSSVSTNLGITILRPLPVGR